MKSHGVIFKPVSLYNKVQVSWVLDTRNYLLALNNRRILLWCNITGDPGIKGSGEYAGRIIPVLERIGALL